MNGGEEEENTKPVVLIDGTSLSPKMKGVGRYAWQLCDALEREMPSGGHLWIVVFEGPLPAFREGFRGELIRIPYRSEFALGLQVIRRLLRETGADVLIRPADKIGICYRARTLTVCHDVNPLIWSAQGTRPLKRRIIDACWEWLRGKAMRCSDRVLCNSGFIRDAACRHFGLEASKTVIGYCGVDERIPALAANGAADEMKRRFEMGFVLAFATGDEREGYDVLPCLWAAARQAGYPGALVVAGVKEEAEYADELRQTFGLMGLESTVTFLPFLGEEELATLAGLYGAADFYLETSRHEGFGMQLVEAMACGTTCFSSGRGALEEIGGGFPLALDIDNPEAAGRTVAAAWKRGEHKRNNRTQVAHARSFDWSDARRAVVEFAWG